MTRTKKLNKLGNAIKLYRGMTTPDGVEPKKWIKPPQKHRAEDIKRWLRSLGVVNVDDCINAIDGFKNFPDFFKWLKEVEDNKIQ